MRERESTHEDENAGDLCANTHRSVCEGMIRKPSLSYLMIAN